MGQHIAHPVRDLHDEEETFRVHCRACGRALATGVAFGQATILTDLHKAAGDQHTLIIKGASDRVFTARCEDCDWSWGPTPDSRELFRGYLDHCSAPSGNDPGYAIGVLLTRQFDGMDYSALGLALSDLRSRLAAGGLNLIPYDTLYLPIRTVGAVGPSALAAAVRRHTIGIGPLPLTLGRPVATDGAVSLQYDTTTELGRLVRTIAQGITDAGEPLAADGPPARVNFAHGDTTNLAGLEMEPVTVTVREIHVVAIDEGGDLTGVRATVMLHPATTRESVTEPARPPQDLPARIIRHLGIEPDWIHYGTPTGRGFIAHRAGTWLGIDGNVLRVEIPLARNTHAEQARLFLEEHNQAPHAGLLTRDPTTTDVTLTAALPADLPLPVLSELVTELVSEAETLLSLVGRTPGLLGSRLRVIVDGRHRGEPGPLLTGRGRTKGRAGASSDTAATIFAELDQETASVCSVVRHARAGWGIAVHRPSQLMFVSTRVLQAAGSPADAARLVQKLSRNLTDHASDRPPASRLTYYVIGCDKNAPGHVSWRRAGAFGYASWQGRRHKERPTPGVPVQEVVIDEDGTITCHLGDSTDTIQGWTHDPRSVREAADRTSQGTWLPRWQLLRIDNKYFYLSLTGPSPCSHLQEG